MIKWFARNGVAANLLMLVIVVTGLFAVSTIRMELFPQFDLDMVSIHVPYPGAAPEEVENGIVKVIEERIEGLEGIKKITSTAAEGFGAVVIEVQRGYDVKDLTDKVKVRIDAIDNFPQEAEEPTVEELIIKRDTLALAVYGDASERALKELAEELRDQLLEEPGITQVEITGIRDYEISINVREDVLRRYGLTFSEVVSAVRASSVDLPGGRIKSQGGEILLRTKGQAYVGDEFRELVLLTRPDGTHLTLGDIAEIEDGFVDDYLSTAFNGKPAAVIQVYSVGEQNVLDIADRAKAFAERVQPELPEGLHVAPFRDFSFYLKGRLMMLIENGIIGLILVFAVLTLFLRPSLAFWVALGIPISFLGAFLVLPLADVSINLASLFGFILVLGIVVDDAIVVGESVFTEFQKNGSGVESSIRGAQKVAIPVTFAVLTTVVAFIPILMLPGFLGKFFYPIPIVVIATLLWSLVESKLILPHHLTYCNVGSHNREKINLLQRVQRSIADGLERFILKVYKPSLEYALKHRYLTVTIFTALFVLASGLVAFKRVNFVFLPPVPSDYIVAVVEMPEGASVESTKRAVEQLLGGLEDLRQETADKGYGDPFDNSVVTIGTNSFEGGPGGAMSPGIQSNIAEIALELVKSEDRVGGGTIEELSAPSLGERWRELTGPIPGSQEVTFRYYAAGGAGSPIDIQLTGRDFALLQTASAEIKAQLATYEGLYDIKDNYSGGKRELKLNVKPSGEMLGITEAMLGRQVRQAFYGEEAQRIQRGRDDIKVMVRYPPEERVSIDNLQNMYIRTPDGREVPFEAVAEAELGQGYPSITRVDGQRVINVTAEANKLTADLGGIKEQLAQHGGYSMGDRAKILLRKLPLLDTVIEEPVKAEPGFMHTIEARYPGLRWSFEGESREQADSFATLIMGALLVLFLIYVLLAIPFKSYLQAFIVMGVVPFGFVGAVFGHLFMDTLLPREFPLSMLSILGIVALSGVVVNDSLVMVDYINRQRRDGMGLKQAVRDAGVARFRAILLTSLTTFVGLLPILFETSLQAQFLIPMAVSLSFGVLFATAITLMLVPCTYIILEDIKSLVTNYFRWVFTGKWG